MGDRACGYEPVSRPATKKENLRHSIGDLRRTAIWRVRLRFQLRYGSLIFPGHTVKGFVGNDLIEGYLDIGMGGVKNALYFFLSDGEIL